MSKEKLTPSKEADATKRRIARRKRDRKKLAKMYAKESLASTETK